MSRKARRKCAGGRPGRLGLALGVLLLLLPGMAGCGKSGKRAGKWWERNVAKTIKGWNERELVITSHPPRADVFVNDVYQGKTPLRLNFKAHVRDMFKGFTVSVHKEGYLPLTRAVSFRAGRVAFRLIKKRGK